MEIQEKIKLKAMKKRNREMAYNLCDISNEILIVSRRLRLLKMKQKINMKNQQALVQRIFIMEDHIEILPAYNMKEVTNKSEKIEEEIKKIPGHKIDEMIKHLLTIRERRRSNKT